MFREIVNSSLHHAAAAQYALEQTVRRADATLGGLAAAVLGLGLHAVRNLVVRHDDKFAAAAGIVGRLGAVGATAAGRAREKFAGRGLENTLGTGYEAGGGVHLL